jgi:hypothetical protein
LEYEPPWAGDSVTLLPPWAVTFLKAPFQPIDNPYFKDMVEHWMDCSYSLLDWANVATQPLWNRVRNIRRGYWETSANLPITGTRFHDLLLKPLNEAWDAAIASADVDLLTDFKGDVSAGKITDLVDLFALTIRKVRQLKIMCAMTGCVAVACALGNLLRRNHQSKVSMYKLK